MDGLDTTTLAIIAGIVILGILAGLGLGALLLRRKPDTSESAAIAAQLSQLQGRLDQFASSATSGQEGLRKAMDERLDAVTKRVGDSLGESVEKTQGALRHLYERLALIDSAQKNISELSGEVTGLKAILSNKQARGAFGEVQLKDVVSSLLPPSAYDFQATLSSGVRPDALIRMPNPPGSVAVDAKFPLEAYRALVDASDDAAKLTAQRAFVSDVKKHLSAISEKYLIPGETAEHALMFVPSEAVYATIHADFPDLVDVSLSKKVLIVSPTTLMAILNTVRAVLRDAEMHKQAAEIQKAVGLMLRDVELLGTRVDKLRTHFNQANKDIDDIETSAKRITSRGERIAEVELEDESSAPRALPGGEN
ncbi:DNA recombination protein RmuC [Hyphobacterium sp. SN044]|uniref:DNA recombination protein RmuC n=1 Tax=Hyphobacterium sp. SN044 TaxID=2912575 RepID=UPI001F1FFDDF|nr:DNA recombination protein RmuC [Hyphobacterium sp. SN044]MCF8879627.1 DNA recombination protein RmuC [Hyphobacterium sp. SN044]